MKKFSLVVFSVLLVTISVVTGVFYGLSQSHKLKSAESDPYNVRQSMHEHINDPSY
jgi:hypothetical protein